MGGFVRQNSEAICYSHCVVSLGNLQKSQLCGRGTPRVTKPRSPGHHSRSRQGPRKRKPRGAQTEETLLVQKAGAEARKNEERARNCRLLEASFAKSSRAQTVVAASPTAENGPHSSCSPGSRCSPDSSIDANAGFRASDSCSIRPGTGVPGAGAPAWGLPILGSPAPTGAQPAGRGGRTLRRQPACGWNPRGWCRAQLP